MTTASKCGIPALFYDGTVKRVPFEGRYSYCYIDHEAKRTLLVYTIGSPEGWRKMLYAPVECGPDLIWHIYANSELREELGL